MHLRKIVCCWLALLALLRVPPAPAQDRTAGEGVPPARVFAPTQYNAHSQNFALAQDRRGMLYVGNFAGVLEYDGLRWRTIPTSNITKVSALLTARNGTVCVGANGEFGYLRPDSVGTLRFVSLSEGLRTRFNEVLAVLETPQGIFFVTRKAAFRWSGQGTEVTELPLSQPVTAAFKVGSALYFFQSEGGLATFRNSQLQPVGRRGKLPTIYDAVGLVPVGTPGQALLVTSNQGLFRLRDGAIEAFDSPANPYLAANQATAAQALRDGSVAVATVRGGLVLLAPDGQLQQTIRGVAGLSDQVVNAMFTDREGNLWLALNNGLAELEVPSPLTLFREATHFTGEIMDLRRYQGTLYVAAVNGLFRVKNATIDPTPLLKASCLSLAETGNALLAATSKGVYWLHDGRLTQLSEEYALCLAASKTDPARVYVGTENGLAILTFEPGQAPRYAPVPAVTERVFGLQEDPQGNLWLETLTAGLFRLAPATASLALYDKDQGLPTKLYNRVAATSQGLLAYNSKGIFRFDAARNRFVPHNPFGDGKAASSFWKNDLQEDAQGNIWTVEGDKQHVTMYRKQGSRYVPVSTPLLPISTSPINVVYPDTENRVWFGGRDGLVRFNPAVRQQYELPYPALIRQVHTVNDQLLYGGAAATSSPEVPALSYRSNDINFEFGAADYPVMQELQFQYMLANYDKTWSDWTTESRKGYTNLPAGNYRFLVRARNIYHTPSRQAAFAFAVLPPWYARWWMIALFAAAGAALLLLLIRWRLKALVREKESLENLIRERTEEVVTQKEELEKQSEELAMKNDQLEKIDLIVQSINAEIDFNNLFQTVLAKFSVIRNMTGASFLVFDPKTRNYRYKALRGNRDLSHVADEQLTLEQAEGRFLTLAREVFEDVYLKNDVQYAPLGNAIDDLAVPKSLITIVIENEGHIDGFITLENTTRANAFDQRDLNMVFNLREHLIAAFIKTRLLENLENTLADLNETQDELIRQEKLASVGQLTKGIVDRILNPLNYVSNFSQSSDSLIDEAVETLERRKDALPADLLDDLLDELQVLKSNSGKIQEHSNSTTRILKDMQRLLREKSRDFLETDLNLFVESRARTALQEAQASQKGAPVSVVFDLAPEPLPVRLLPPEFGQVIQNIISNSYYTLLEKQKTLSDFAPEIRVSTRRADDYAELRIRDNGKGIPSREIEKIFSPFFTTKPTSKGTGLGLFMAKDIVETHKGRIDIASQEGAFTELLISLPTVAR